jgi:nitrite reductase/ring-hydroxylating ferredoxin subunit
LKERRIKMENNKNTEQRRDFLKKAGALIGAGAAITSLSSLIVGCKDETIPLPPPPPPGSNYQISLASYPSLETVGTIVTCQAILSTDASKMIKVIVKREDADNFIIIQSGCSHQGDQELPAAVNTSGNVVCPRHLAEFSLNKANAGVLTVNPQGVAAKALKVYNHEHKKTEQLLVLAND